MKTHDPVKFLTELELATTDFKIIPFSRTEGIESAEEGKPESFVDNKSLISFVSNVKGQNREDVLRSTLLAQKAADFKYPDNIDLIKWYEVYINVLKNIGWVVEANDFSKFNSFESIFEMENVVIDLIASMIGSNYLAIIKSTLNAVKSLSDQDNRINVFKSNSVNLNKGNFQLGLVAENDGAVSMNLGAFTLESEEKINNILFFKGGKDKVALNYNNLKCTLDIDLYATIRNQIKEKLGKQVSAFIGKIEIGSI